MSRIRLVQWQIILFTALIGGCATAPVSLASKSWTLHTINDELLYGNKPITLSFDNSEQLSGSTGCNRYRASYSSDHGAINIATIATTKKLCAPEIMEQEKRYLRILGDAATYVDKCGRLKISSQENEILRFNLQK